ncbi:hematopoietic SH2 domain-containing protein [Tenrec ecaudatus]|uniref:hematopoietic SH2 domain-containing protein n=1 Tax=Tenrec ecaudatus TaxID=94439 RepID=UPI003F5A6068
MTEDRTLPPPLPPRLDWFVHTQVDQLTQDGVPQWFHGAISREAAENLLEPQPPGSFLIRVSHSHVGYTLSYRAQNCCRHFMVKLLDDGSFMIPGGGAAHASLHALVTFHQQKPMRPHGELLTQPCGQEDPTRVDYEGLFLYTNALVQEAAREHPGPSQCTSLEPSLLHWSEERTASAEMDRAPPGNLASSGPLKAPLSDARQKLWKRLKTLPKAGRRAQQQLKSHLTAMSLPLFSDTRLPVATAAGLEVARNSHEEAANQEDNFSREPCEGAHAAPGSPRDRNAFRRAGSWSGVSPGDQGLHRTVVKSPSLQVTNQETRGVEEPQDWLPEEYRPPPPFAPGYC